jgi:hypothetical protein
MQWLAFGSVPPVGQLPGGRFRAKFRVGDDTFGAPRDGTSAARHFTSK